MPQTTRRPVSIASDCRGGQARLPFQQRTLLGLTNRAVVRYRGMGEALGTLYAGKLLELVPGQYSLSWLSEAMATGSFLGEITEPLAVERDGEGGNQCSDVLKRSPAMMTKAACSSRASSTSRSNARRSRSPEPLKRSPLVTGEATHRAVQVNVCAVHEVHDHPREDQLSVPAALWYFCCRTLALTSDAVQVRLPSLGGHVTR